MGKESEVARRDDAPSGGPLPAQNGKAASHTPGPWLLDGHTIYTLDAYTGSNRWWTSVQAVYHGPANEYPLNITRAELTANARLIAAAPDLLEALKEAELQISYLHERWQPTGSGNAVLARIQAALAKACTPSRPSPPLAQRATTTTPDSSGD